MCGEAVQRQTEERCRRGPSPRVRGSHDPQPAAPPGCGSIPACAGKPNGEHRPQSGAQVHPRVCGEARCLHSESTTSEGPSPRVRGSRGPPSERATSRRSIPACAGKPQQQAQRRGQVGVHPRVCGEALRLSDARHGPGGPSPRVRGSHDTIGAHLECHRSIPACAGKPVLGEPHRLFPTVHPRVCGEASPISASVRT